MPHGGDGAEIAILATSDQGHGRAVSRRFRYRQIDVHGRHDLKAVWQGRRWIRGSEEEHEVRAIASGVFNQLLYERVSETPAFVIRSAVEHVAAMHQRKPALMCERPHRLCLSRVVLCKGLAAPSPYSTSGVVATIR
jgi:hypothetical protein